MLSSKWEVTREKHVKFHPVRIFLETNISIYLGELCIMRENLPVPLHPLDSQIYIWYFRQSNGTCALTSFLSTEDCSKKIRSVTHHSEVENIRNQPQCCYNRHLALVKKLPQHHSAILDLDSPDHQEKWEINFYEHSSSIGKQNMKLSRAWKGYILWCYCS